MLCSATQKLQSASVQRRNLAEGRPRRTSPIASSRVSLHDQELEALKDYLYSSPESTEADAAFNHLAMEPSVVAEKHGHRRLRRAANYSSSLSFLTTFLTEFPRIMFAPNNSLDVLAVIKLANRTFDQVLLPTPVDTPS